MADNATIIGSAIAAIAGAVGTIGAARAVTKSKLDAAVDAVKALAARVKAIEESEPAELAKLRTEVREMAEAVERLAADVAAIRTGHERLSGRFDAHLTDETERRARAKSAAMEREVKGAKDLAALVGDVQRLRDKLDVLLELAGGLQRFAEAHRGK